jgi:hypothetical protein
MDHIRSRQYLVYNKAIFAGYQVEAEDEIYNEYKGTGPPGGY